MGWGELLTRLGIALFVGTFIGFERQWRHGMAGMRTNALVSLGACLFVLLSVMVENDSTSSSRIAAQVVSGIGFLGGGVIIRDGFSIRGLNTAATLWCSAAVGVLSGAGFIMEALVGATIVLLANLTLRPIALYINDKSQVGLPMNTQYILTVSCGLNMEREIRSLILKSIHREHMQIQKLSSEIDIEDDMKITVVIDSTRRDDEGIEGIIQEVCKKYTVGSSGWQMTLKEVE